MREKDGVWAALCWLQVILFGFKLCSLFWPFFLGPLTFWQPKRFFLGFWQSTDLSDFRSQKLHEFNQYVKNDQRVEVVVLTMREGITMVRRISDQAIVG